ncbi:MAG: N-6 DNA methylase [Planctomycetota bacterium]|nr:N-6 DNA methylase [Planctomycetota bacterium]
MDTALAVAGKNQPKVAIIVQQGKVLDFIDGLTQRSETPEEHVRQEIAKSLVREYRYPKAHIAVEFPIQMGTRKPRADLVIFTAEKPHVQEHARIIVECKAPTIKMGDKDNGVGQLKSYLDACPNAIFGMWINGVERVCYRRVEKAGKRFWEEVPDLPRYGKEDVDDRPTFDQLNPATSDALLFTFRRCHNFIAGNQGLQKPQAFWELLKIIFCKIHDEKGSEIEFYAAANERHSLNGALKVKGRIEALFAEVKEEYPQIFKQEEHIDLEPKVATYIVSQLQMYTLLDSDVDVKGRAYEEIVGSNLRGDRGEFFTPRNICRMAVQMLDPGEKQLVLDPACGTGGFLITAMNHVIGKIEREERQKWKNNHAAALKAIRSRISKYAEKFIVGIDFNPELVKASKMNMVMNNDGSGGLYQANSLENPATLWIDKALRDRKLLGRVELLFTNPPFGSKIPVTDPSILGQYDLGHKWTYDEKTDQWIKGEGLQKSQPPEILFVERCIQFLKPGVGRAAIVLPDGILGSPGLGYVREWILRNTQILASIDLHPDTFQPFVSIQTSVLILQRKTQEQIDLETAAGRISDYEIFMAVANHVGHDKRGQETYVRDAQGNEMFDEVEKQVWEFENGVRVVTNHKMQKKVLDDNTHQIAEVFRQWLYQHDL